MKGSEIRDMESTPKVSVVIPMYNSEKYIRECIESALAQSLHDIEIVCVDDGSTDNTLKIVNEYAEKDDRVVVISKSNAGTGHTMNVGFDSARGEYLAILESDDYILPKMLEDLYAVAKGYDNLDFVKSDFYRFWGEKGNRTVSYGSLSGKPAHYNVLLNPSEDLGLFRANNVMCTGIYKRDFIQEHAIRYNETPGAAFQDNGFWFQVFSWAKRAMFIDRAYYMIRRDNEASSVKSAGKVYCMCDEYDFIEKKMENADGVHEDILFICSKMRFSNYLHTLGRIDESFKYGFVKRFAEDFKRLEAEGKLSRHYFKVTEWTLLQAVMSDPLSAYLTNFYVPLENKEYIKIQDELQRIKKKLADAERREREFRSSRSWRIGRIVTYFPRVFKRFLKKNENKATQSDLDKPQALTSIDQEILRISSLSEAEYPAYLEEWFERRTGWPLDLLHPETFNEKIQWLKLYDSTSIKTKLADKYRVRDWVAEKIGHDHLIPLLGVYNSFDEIDFDEMPNQFVMKANHGSGWNIVVEDKKKLDLSAAKRQFDAWMNLDYSKRIGLELHYGGIEPKIVVEEFISNGEGELFDYRFFCFNGEPFSIWVDVGSGTDQHRRDIYDLDWNLMPVQVNYPNLEHRKMRPAQLEDMIEYARVLSEGFAFARVDFYAVGGTVFFGEITFTPQSGIGRWDPPEENKTYGDLLVLPDSKVSVE